MYKIKPVILFLFTIFLMSSYQSGVASEKKSYTIGVQDFKEYLPYSEYKNNEYKGFNRTILDMFAKSNGISFQYRAFPIKRLNYFYLNGFVDLVYPDNPYWVAEKKIGKKIKYSDPVVEYIDGVLVHPDNYSKGLKQLKNLGVVAGFTPFTYLGLIKKGTIQKTEIYDYKNLLRMTILKRLDGAYSNIAVSQYYLNNVIENKKGLVFDPNLPHTRSKRYLSSFKFPLLINKFSSFLQKNREIIETLKRKYNVEEGIKN